MQTIALELVDQNGQVQMQASGAELVSLVYPAAFLPGDHIVVKTCGENKFCVFQLEDTLPPALVFCKGRVSIYPIPAPEHRTVFSPKAFVGNRHLIRARYATAEEIQAERNLACNPYDFHENDCFFPHALANVETRGEAVFAARNAIDGMFENAGHGEWPYQSWGINRDPDAAITLLFGREVVVQAVALTLRADFPHDSYWTQATLRFSDGHSETLRLKKSHLPQRFPVSLCRTTSVCLSHLIKAPDDSPFPALTQLEVIGIDVTN